MTHEDRQRVRAAIDEAKRAEIDAAHGRIGQLIENWDDTPPPPAPIDHNEIRRRLANGEQGKDLAVEYGLSPSRISGIKNGRHR